MAACGGTSAEPQFGVVGHLLGEAKGFDFTDAAGQGVGEFAYFNRVVGEDVCDSFGHEALLLRQSRGYVFVEYSQRGKSQQVDQPDLGLRVFYL